jgi:hypothetical protein
MTTTRCIIGRTRVRTQLMNLMNMKRTNSFEPLFALHKICYMKIYDRSSTRVYPRRTKKKF